MVSLPSRAQEKLGLSSPAFPLILSVWARTLEVLRDIEQCAAYSRMLVAVCEEQGFSLLLASGQCQLGWVIAKQGDIGKGQGPVVGGYCRLEEHGVEAPA